VDNQSAFWSLHHYVPIRKDISSISVFTRNGNGSYGTEERQRNGGNQALDQMYVLTVPVKCKSVRQD